MNEVPQLLFRNPNASLTVADISGQDQGRAAGSKPIIHKIHPKI